MSQLADTQRTTRHKWALPGGSHDRVVALLKWTLPVGVGILAAFLAFAPFTLTGDVSFVLDKNQVDVAGERMRVREALYRGEDSQGRPFSLQAGSAVQKTSANPVVDMHDLIARILMKDGPASLTANRGFYNMDSERVGIVGPVQYQSADGYRMTTRDVGIDLKSRRMQSLGRVDGRMPMGTFSGDRLEGDLAERTFTLIGHATLRIEQNGLKGR
ncbi:MAG: LPS export ABC transporter periplasmic protein LptC [Sphingobium sp.]